MILKTYSKTGKIIPFKAGLIIFAVIIFVSVFLYAEHYYTIDRNISNNKVKYPDYAEPLKTISFANDGMADADTQINIYTSAKSAILIDAESKNIIYQTNSRQKLPMASTTKIATAITAIASGVPLDKKIKITKAMTGAEGSSIYLYEGEVFTLKDLLYALMLNSANDAAEAIAISIGGSVEKFAAMMNETAADLKLTDTNFTNPHGLDDELHYTTAYDLAVITAYALENEEFAKIVSTQKSIIYPKNADGSDNKEGARFLINHNRMLRIYDGCIGVKTGFTKRSGRSLVSAAVRDGVKLVAVTINAPDDWRDHRNLFDYGFRAYRSVTVCEASQYEFEVDVVNGVRYVTGENGKTIEEKVPKIKCVNSTGLTLTMPADSDPGDVEYMVELPHFVYAPVKSGDVLGQIRFEYEGKTVGYLDITAVTEAEVYVYKSIIEKIKNFFKK